MAQQDHMELKTMTLGEHLEELRGRILRAVVALLASTTLCWFIFDPVILNFIKAPLDMVAGTHSTNPFAFHNPLLDILRDRMSPDIQDLGRLKVLKIFEPIIVRFKVSVLTGAILASPVILGQLWKFVEAGLYEHEKKYAVRYGSASLFLFLAGCGFSFFILFPIAVSVLCGQGSFDMELRLEYYVSEATFFTLGVGSLFELPLVLLFLNAIGLVDARGLAEKRRHIILAILVLAAIITPPDPLTQVIVALPVFGLYEATVIVLKVKEKRMEKENEQRES